MLTRISFLIITAFILTACATGEGPSEGPSLEERIKTAKQSLNIVTEKSADWCGPAKKCKYLGDIYCDIEGESSSDDPDQMCIERMRHNAVIYGGDTVVYQQQGNIRGTLDHYRIFGQLYNCNNTNQQINKEYSAERRLIPLTQQMMVTKAYADMCKTTTGCKINHRASTCGSMQAAPYHQCRRKFDKEYKSGSGINHIVYKDDLVNRAGIYRLYIDSYACK